MIKNECRHAYKLLDHAECLWCENCVEKLTKRLSKKPEVTEEWIDEKAEKLTILLCRFMEVGREHDNVSSDYTITKAKDFIRSLVEEIK